MKKHKLLKLAISLIATVGLTSLDFAITPNQAQVFTKSYSDHSLAQLKFHHQEIVTVDHNKPRFSKKSESKQHGPWQKFSNLDFLNRAHTANALLNKKLMPHARRQALTWNPTGWHNKRIKSDWLFNRCHLIGYQLTGQNNNPRNLITGTRELNDPDMLKYENKVADYIKQSNHHYIRYRVTPIYKGNDLLANGVEMEAQSIGDNSVHFNIYIFNEQPGVTLNYRTGTSKVHASAVSHKKARKHHARKTKKRRRRTSHKCKRVIHHKAGKISTARYRVVGNRRSKIYHVMNGQNYHMSAANAVYFKSEAAARRAGYRKSLR